MHLRYGLNIGDHWRDPAWDLPSEDLIARIKDAGTSLVRIFPGIGGKSPAEHWKEFAGFFDTIQRNGAAPMIAPPCPPPWNHAAAGQLVLQGVGRILRPSAD